MKFANKFILATTAASALLLTGSAKADTVDFSTTGSFSGPNASGSNLVYTDIAGSGVTTLSFTGVSGVSYPDPGTYTGVDLGTFNVSTTNSASVEELLSGNMFQFTVNQTDPSGNSGSIDSSSVSGSIVNNNGYAAVDFLSSDTVEFSGGLSGDTETYTVNDLNLVPISGGNGSLELTGTVTATEPGALVASAPEPALAEMTGLGLGLISLALFRRRKVA